MNERIAQIAWEGDILRFGHYTNASGGIFPLMVELRLLFSKPDYLKVIGEELGKRVYELGGIQLIAGAATAGIPPAVACSLATGIDFVYVRAEPKKYMGNLAVEGDFKRGSKAVIVDDWVVKGKGKIVLAQNMRDVGIVVNDMLTVMSCECPLIPEITKADLAVHTLLNTTDFFRYGLEHNHIFKELYDLVWDVYKDDNLFKWSPEQAKWKQIMELARKENFKFLGE